METSQVSTASSTDNESDSWTILEESATQLNQTLQPPQNPKITVDATASDAEDAVQRRDDDDNKDDQCQEISAKNLLKTSPVRRRRLSSAR